MVSKIRKSEIKLDVTTWDSDEIKTAKGFLRGCEGFLEPVDVNSLQWSNDFDEVVIMVKRLPKTLKELAKFIELFDGNPDELFTAFVNGKLVIRMWWD